MDIKVEGIGVFPHQITFTAEGGFHCEEKMLFLLLRSWKELEPILEKWRAQELKEFNSDWHKAQRKEAVLFEDLAKKNPVIRDPEEKSLDHYLIENEEYAYGRALERKFDDLNAIKFRKKLK